jgi:hypothetical protein
MDDFGQLKYEVIPNFFGIPNKRSVLLYLSRSTLRLEPKNNDLLTFFNVEADFFKNQLQR